MQYWIKTNADGMLTEEPLTAAKNDYAKVDVPATSTPYFTRCWQII